MSTLSEALLDLMAPTPQPLLSAATWALHHQPLFHLIVTNVPGPPVPVHVLGARMLRAYPFVPLVGNTTVGVAALSYDDRLGLGLLVDPETCPDIDALPPAMWTAMKELVSEARLPAARASSAVPPPPGPGAQP